MDTDAKTMVKEIISDKDEPKEKAKGKRGKLDSVRIEAAENGFIVECNYRSQKNQKADAPMAYEPPERKVFANAADVAAFVKAELG